MAYEVDLSIFNSMIVPLINILPFIVIIIMNLLKLHHPWLYFWGQMYKEHNYFIML